MYFVVRCKYGKDRIENSGDNGQHITIQSLWMLSVATVFSFNLLQNLMQDSGPTTMMLLIKFDCDRPTGLRDICV